MDFYEVLDRVAVLLQGRKRVTYGALKLQFKLDDEQLEVLKEELIEAQRIALDENGKVLVWVGAPLVSSAKGQGSSSPQPPAPQTLNSELRTSQPPISYTPPHLADRIRATTVTDGERKTITALFADLKGSTALIEGLDPEEARAIIDPALQLMMDAVHQYDGYVAQALGDGIFALFGAPIAHEDHPQRAVYAALRMQDEMRRYADTLRQQGSPPLLMRVGLNTGEVVLRSIRKDDLHADYVPVGHSTNLAARMEQLANPGSIVVSAYTHRLTDGYFAFKDLGPTQIKGAEEPLQIAQSLFGRWVFNAARGNHTTARALGEQFLTVADRQQDSTLSLVTHAMLGLTLLWRGEFTRAQAHLDQAFALYDPEHHRDLAYQVGPDPGLLALGWAAGTLWCRGYPDQALAGVRHALSLAHALAHPFSLTAALGVAAFVYLFCREDQDAHAQTVASLTLAHEHGFAFLSGVGMTLQGWALVERGTWSGTQEQGEAGLVQLQEGLAALRDTEAEIYVPLYLGAQEQGEAGLVQLQEGLAALRDTEAEIYVPLYLGAVAQGYGQKGQAEEGLKVIAEALAIVEKNGEHWNEAELYRLRGELTLAQSKASLGHVSDESRTSQEKSQNPNPQHPAPGTQAKAEAEGYFCKAIAVAQRQQAKSLELRAVMSLARLWQSQGKIAEARQMLAEIYNWFTEGFDTKDLQEAKALIEELSH